MGNRKWEMENREMGDRKWKREKGKQEMGNRKRETGNEKRENGKSETETETESQLTFIQPDFNRLFGTTLSLSHRRVQIAFLSRALSKNK